MSEDLRQQLLASLAGEQPSSTKPYTVIVMRHGGSHLILPLVRAIARQPLYRPKGNEALICKPSGPTIIFIRNPRNRLVSFFRWKRGFPETLAERDAALAWFMTLVTGRHSKKLNPLQFMLAWANRWMREDGLLVRFEDMIGPHGEAEAVRIQKFLGTEGDAALVHKAIVGATTFTGRHSDWREWFGPQSLARYRANGGEDLDKLMRYENE